MGAGGRPVIPASAHIRLAAATTNGGAVLLRRSYNFSDGIDPLTGELDAGLFFLCFQKDPRTQFVPIQLQLAEHDALNEYTVATGSSLFACPPGLHAGEVWGDSFG